MSLVSLDIHRKLICFFGGRLVSVLENSYQHWFLFYVMISIF